MEEEEGNTGGCKGGGGGGRRNSRRGRMVWRLEKVNTMEGKVIDRQYEVVSWISGDVKSGGKGIIFPIYDERERWNLEVKYLLLIKGRWMKDNRTELVGEVKRLWYEQKC